MGGLAIPPPYKAAPAPVRAWWSAGVAAAVGYGIVLAVIAARVPDGADLTGRFPGQPAAKVAMAVLLAVAAAFHPVVRERRWLVAALLLSALGDFFLAIPWWTLAFVTGLGSFLLAHLCYLAVLVPLRGDTRPLRLAAVGVLAAGIVAALIWFWPRLERGMAVPVVVYMTVLGLMVTAALLARLPTPWTALGAVLFAISDGMIGVGRFVLGSQALELPIWWVYAAAQVLITAGFFFGRATGPRTAG